MTQVTIAIEAARRMAEDENGELGAGQSPGVVAGTPRRDYYLHHLLRLDPLAKRLLVKVNDEVGRFCITDLAPPQIVAAVMAYAAAVADQEALGSEILTRSSSFASLIGAEEITKQFMIEEELIDLAVRLQEALHVGLTVDWGNANKVGERRRIGHRIWLHQHLAVVPYKRGFRRIKRGEIDQG